MRICSIQAFLSAYTNRSMTRASSDLNLSQPALTKIIQTLELDLGVKLFIRGPRGIEPTEYAELLAPRAKRILAELGAARNELRALAGGKAGCLRIGADSYVAGEILPAAMTSVLSDGPDLKIEIVTGTSDHLAQATRDGDLDVLITSISRRTDLRGLSSIDILKEKYSIVARSGHPLARRKSVNLAEVVSYPWIHIGQDFSVSSNLVPILEREGVPLPERIVETDSIAYLVAHLLRSDSLSYQPRRLIRAREISTLNVAETMNSPSWFRVVAAYKKDQVLPQSAQRLVRHLTISAGDRKE